MHNPSAEIKAVLFDLDDTLLKTHDTFSSVIEPLKRRIADSLVVDYVEFSDKFEKAIVSSYNQLKVNPDKFWKKSFEILRQDYEISSELEKSGLDELMRIYTILPEIYEDTVTILEYLSRKGYNLGLITHASQKWTDFKLDGHDLRKYFSYVQYVSIDKFKTSEDWAKGAAEMNVPVGQIAVVGDNLKADIIAGLQAGFAKAFWLVRGSAWTVNREGDMPAGAVKLTSLLELKKFL